MDAETKERFAQEVGEAWRRGDQAKMDTLCRDYEVSVDPDDSFGTERIRINAAPRLPAQRVEFTVVKAGPA